MPTTLAQAIEDLALKAGTFERPSTPVLEPVLAAIDQVARARVHLHGLEEANAVIDSREHAFERALELSKRLEANGDPTGTDSERVIEIARFLAPGWEALETGNDELGPTSTPAELEASEAGAVSYADELEDKLDAALLELAELRPKVADTLCTLAGESLGYMSKDDAAKASAIIQAALNERSATAQVADAARRTAEGQARAAEAELEKLRNADTELGANITIRNLEDDVRGLREELVTAEESVLAQRDRIAGLITERDALAGDKDRALEVIRGHVEELDQQRTAYDALVEIADDRRRAIEATERERDEAKASYDHLAKANAERIVPEGSAELMALQHHLGIVPPLHLPDVDDVDTLNITGVGLHGDRIAFVLWGRELDRDAALVMAAYVIAVGDRDSRFAAILRKVFSA